MSSSFRPRDRANVAGVPIVIGIYIILIDIIIVKLAHYLVCCSSPTRSYPLGIRMVVVVSQVCCFTDGMPQIDSYIRPY